MGKTVVVGGGPAGLAAAFTLEKGGAECTVLEKRDFAGGRIYGVVKEGFTLDFGAQFFFSRYHSTFDLMGRLGIADQIHKFPNPVGILRDGNVHVLYRDLLDYLKHPSAGLRFGALSSRGKREGFKLGMKMLQLGKKLDFDDPLKAIELDNISLADYVRRNFGDEVLEYVLQPVVGALALGDPEDMSAAYGLSLLWYPLPGLSTVRPGMGFLAESLAKNVSDVRLSTDVKRIVVEDKKVKAVEISKGKKTETIECDNVVCTAPGDEAAAVLADLPPAMTDILGNIKYSACAHVLFAVQHKIMGDLYAIATPRREGYCLSGVTENANKYSGYAPPNCGIMSVFTYGKFGAEMMTMKDSEIQDKVTKDIQMFMPQFPDDPVFCEVFKWPKAVCLSSPGMITAVQRLKIATREYEGLHLAGEYLGMPSVEAAVHTGVNAARMILRSS